MIRTENAFPISLLILLLSFGFVVSSAHAAVGQGAQAVLKSADQLKLTRDQRAKMQTVIRATSKEYNRIRSEERGKSGTAAKMDALRREAQENVLGMLTADQRKRWNGLNAPTPIAKPTVKKPIEPIKGQTGSDGALARSLIIPTIKQMKNPPFRGAYGPSAEIIKTKPHPTVGGNYIILTDHTDSIALSALEQLADHHHGSVLKLKSLGTMHRSPSEFMKTQSALKKLKPRYVAIAPRPASYRENMHLCMLRLLSGLDKDPSLDVFPGYLIASDSKRLAKLVEKTIQFKPMKKDEIEPVSIGTIEDTNSLRYRSYQKAKVMQKVFAADGIDSSAIIVTTRHSHVERSDFPNLDKAGGNIAMMPKSERHTFGSLSPAATQALNASNILFMFGHGTPGRICGAEVSAYAEIDFSNELVFCGSCMSASPYNADRIDLGAKKGTKRFAFHAMDNGAVMMLGHMGLCGGFPKVYPMGEMVLDGLSTGEAYQRLMNALIGSKPIPAYYPEPAPKKAIKGVANGLLYILWGDPALVAIAQ
ncbi:hypothetical protein N9059_00320 [bacterium]|nr:hypothetical protein [bacterium]